MFAPLEGFESLPGTPPGMSIYEPRMEIMWSCAQLTSLDALDIPVNLRGPWLRGGISPLQTNLLKNVKPICASAWHANIDLSGDSRSLSKTNHSYQNPMNLDASR